MAKRIIVLSGPVAARKTSLVAGLVRDYDLEALKTRQLINQHNGGDVERRHLQAAGEALDRETGGIWVADALAASVQAMPVDAMVIVDSVRIERQVRAIREKFGSRVTHIHLTAPMEILEARYASRRGHVQELSSYQEVRANATEQGVEALAEIADVVIDTHDASEDEVTVRAAGHLGLYGRSIDRLVDVLVGGQYGSEGKGQVSAYLAQEYGLLVRVGGPNAGHKVYEVPDPYTFHLLPSGTRVSTADVAIGPGAVLSIPTLQREIADCGLTPTRLFIDPNAMIIDPSDILREEERLRGPIGSTAQGVGVATARKVMRTAADPPVVLAGQVNELRPFVRDTREVLERAFARGQRVFLEGTQGTGLSLHHGSYPFVTSRDTTVSGCLAEAGIAPGRVRKIVMVCRTYPIRVAGESGPLANELTWDEVAARSGIPIEELNRNEKTSTTKRARRVAEFDWALLRRAVSLNGPTDIALTFADYLDIKNRDAHRHEQLTADTVRFIEKLERFASAPVSLIATRFHTHSIIDRRNW